MIMLYIFNNPIKLFLIFLNTLMKSSRHNHEWTKNGHLMNTTKLCYLCLRERFTLKLMSLKLYWGCGSNNDVINYDGYYINNFHFYSKVKDHKCRIQNSWVTIQVEVVQLNSSKDRNMITTFMSYFKMIEDI